MAVRPIAHLGHPELRIVASPVEPDRISSPEIQTLIDDLIDTMRAATGAGLAATQVLAHQRVAVIEVTHNPRYPYKPPIPLTVLVNPEIVVVGSEQFENNEGCLSVPGLRGNVWRATEIVVRAFDREGRWFEREVKGLSAGTFQHELDHLDGRLFVDRVTDPTTLSTWEQFERFHKEAFVQRVEELVARYGS